MRPRQLLLAVLVLASSFAMIAHQAHGQRPLRRLIERVAPLIAPPADPSDTNRLPARPVPERSDGRTDSPDDGAAPRTAPGVNQTNNRANPAARYRVPGPTPAVTPDGVEPAGAKQGGANLPAEKAVRPASGAFGQSILKPLDFEDPNADQPSADPNQASLGIKGVEANPGYPAVQVTEISKYSMADEDGLRVGDYIFAIDGIPTSNVRGLADHVSKLSPGQRVRLRIGRSGQVADVDVRLVPRGGKTLPQPNLPQPTAAQPIQPVPTTSAPRSPELPPQPVKQPQIGAEINDVAGRRGVVVASIEPGSIADQAGLLARDRIVSVDKRLVYDAVNFSELLASSRGGSTAEIQLIREDQLVNVTLDFDAKPLPTVSATTGDETTAGQNSPSRQPGTGTSSLAGGLGSVLGGMFGSKSAAATNASSQEEQQAAGSAELPAPKSDPLALEPSDSNQENSADAENSASAAALRDEIERLKEQLKSLESRLDD